MGNTKENSKDEQDGGFMVRLATFIVDKRNLFFLIFAILCIFSAVSRNWVSVENSLAAFLPETAETRIGLDLMDEEFITYGTAEVMVTNITYDNALALSQEIESMDGVAMVSFQDDDAAYQNFSALYTVMFHYSEKDERCLESLEAIEEQLEQEDYYVSTTLIDNTSKNIAEEMQVIIILVSIIVVAVLFLTSQTYAEVPVLLITFLSSAIIAMGTNFFLGTISFVSNSVTIVLQLALSVDYAIIFCNRYKEEHQLLPIREAVIVALSKAIPEITASSMTTIGGLLAMMFMQFLIGPDMAICLIKAILLSLCSVFLLMPGLLMLFGKAMDKTRHKNFIPQIPWVGKFAYKSRFVMPPVFLVGILIALYISNQCPYVYGYSTLTTPIQNQDQLTDEMIEDSFGSSNMVALVVPKGTYETQDKLVTSLLECSEIDSVVSLTNTEAMDGYMLTDKLGARAFSELMDIDYDMAQLLYTAYAADDENYGRIVGGIASYDVPLIDIICFLYQEVQDGYVTLDDDQMNDLTDAYDQIQIAKDQLVGREYDRMLVYLNLPQEGEETFAFLDKMHDMSSNYYTGNVYVIGDSTSQYDLYKTFDTDNKVVNVISIIAVLIVLLFTFKSVGMPILLIAVIQGSIWINFAIPALQQSNLFFMSYLIVSSIQMGANIDYAIVISSRFLELKDQMPKEQAIIETMNFAFPTIITSGSMLSIAGILIGNMTSEAAIVGIGQCLGRGTIISIIIVMFILPQILLLGEKIIDRTSFSISLPIQGQRSAGLMRLDGRVHGRINGVISGEVHALVRGEANVYMDTGIMEPEPDVSSNLIEENEDDGMTTDNSQDEEVQDE